MMVLPDVPDELDDDEEESLTEVVPEELTWADSVFWRMGGLQIEHG
jgi:hypothetical protein